MRRHHTPIGLQTVITLFACLIVALSLLVTDVIISEKIADSTRAVKADEANEISRIVANSPNVIEALEGKRPRSELQPFVEKIRSLSDVRFIVVIDMNRIRQTHPNVEKIGEYYEETDAEPAFAGQHTTSINQGSLGGSMRAFAPIFAADGRQIGVVLVGILTDSVQQAVNEGRSGIFAGVAFGMLAGIIGALILSRNIKKILFGFEPIAIAKLFQERNAMLQSVREGIIAVDRRGRITIVNEEAMRLFRQAGIVGNPIGRKAEKYIPNTRLEHVLRTGEIDVDQEQEMNGITIVANRVPIIVDDEIVGAIATFRDKTEMNQLAEKLTGVSLYAEALRAQTHEFMNKMHVILGMIRMGYHDRLADYVSKIAQQYQVEVGSVVRKIKDPVFAGFLLGKLSRARELGVELRVGEDSYLPEPKDHAIVHDLITIVGNLIDNAFDAVAEMPDKQVWLEFVQEDGQMVFSVRDSGPGMEMSLIGKIFERGFSTKGTNRGIGLHLALQCAQRLGGELKVSSEIDKGTTFRVVLPYQAADEDEDEEDEDDD